MCGHIEKELVNLVHSAAGCKLQTAFQVDMGMPLFGLLERKALVE
jgi:hypothetical protein